MKLSELFKTPFKLKGGATLNLRGFSKRVVDKEIEESGGGEDSSLSKLLVEATSSEQIEFIEETFNNAVNYSLEDLLNGIKVGDEYVSIDNTILYRVVGSVYVLSAVKQNNKYYLVAIPEYEQPA